MSEWLIDQAARDRFRDEWDRNFAVSANAGSGKTTAISERLAAMALVPRGAELLRRTAVVTFTKKAAAQIGQRARQVLMRRLAEAGRTDLAPLDHLERAFFGTIHSFCLLLAQRHGQTLGLNLNPAVVGEDDEALWHEFLEQDTMQFTTLPAAPVEAFLRHTPLESIFALANRMELATARRFVGQAVPVRMAEPSPVAMQEIIAASTRAGKSAESLKHNQETAVNWLRRFRGEKTYLPFPKPEGTAAGIKELYARLFSPVKGWLAQVGANMAAELALRYRAWRFDRGIQTYADQIEAALAVLEDSATLEAIRAQEWRVVLDEAQDTDPQQFAVLVEITRPPGAPLRSWPGGGPGPRAGHFCMVGDGQQAIYGSRADIRNFQAHLDAFSRGEGGECLTFSVTFRAPDRVIELLNATLPGAFGAGRLHNLGSPAAEGAASPLLQVKYEPLVARPDNQEGEAAVLHLITGGDPAAKVEIRLATEIRHLAVYLRENGPAGVGARNWGEICLLAPRNEWLITARKELEAVGLKAALQMRKNRNGDNPVYAWISGLLAAVCDPDNLFEWTGVLREVFGLSDAIVATWLKVNQRFFWDEPDRHPEPLRSALDLLRPLVERVDAEAEPLESFARDLTHVAGLVRKAGLVDPSGGLGGELQRLLAQAAELSLEGAGPRDWLKVLLAAREQGRPVGRPSDEAINLLTSHSAKGLEWPVVIPIGLWRAIGKQPEDGLRLMPATGVDPAKVYFDSESVPIATREAREKERLRELVRLLYVSVTRARRALVLPWVAAGKVEQGSFAEIWGAPWTEMKVWPAPQNRSQMISSPELLLDLEDFEAAQPVPVDSIYPVRLLPHQLAHRPDLPRTVRHESGADEPRPMEREDPIEYGLWWHETMEFLPWEGSAADAEASLKEALAVAEVRGFRTRAEQEIGFLRASSLWSELRSGRWRVFRELSVLAPLGSASWVDGVIDLVAQDIAADELWVIDWKTNRIRTAETEELLLERLVTEYRPQLEAYGTCLSGFFPTQRIKLGIYASGAGAWRLW